MIFLVRKSIIQKNLFGSFRYRKSALLRWANPLIANPNKFAINLLRKLCTAHPLQIATHSISKQSQNFLYFTSFLKLAQIWIRTFKASWGSFKSVKRSANCKSHKIGGRKLQICKLTYLRKFHLSVNFWKFANLWILQFMELRHTHNAPMRRGAHLQ